MAKKANNAERNAAVDRLCLELACSTQSLNYICNELRAEDSAFPTRRTIYTWFQQDDGLRERFDKAKLAQVELFVDEIVEIINTQALNAVDVQMLKLRFEAIKWLVGKLAPYKYGDNTEQKLAEIERKVAKYEELLNGKSRSA